MSYTHLTILEREKIYLLSSQNCSLHKIADSLGRNVSTVSRELKRNPKDYSPSKAQVAYQKRRKKSRPHKKLENPLLFIIVVCLFLGRHWSPEQIAGRLKLENYPIQISYKTIYRAIYAGMFNTPEQKHSTGNRGAIRKLRHKGKPRRNKNVVETRGKLSISHPLSERPQAANERIRLGDFEADTVAGKLNQECLLTLTDRKSRYLICRKLKNRTSAEVNAAIIDALKDEPLESITPDRGKEFARHAQITAELGVNFYFPPPHHPWDRGTNENTNGLLREYYPKGYNLGEVTEEELQAVVEDLNSRPRKTLGYRTPAEIYFSKTLHLI